VLPDSRRIRAHTMNIHEAMSAVRVPA